MKTSDGWVIEFQHSYLKPEERRSREAFYKKMVWVVDGLRRGTDGAQFQKAWERGRPVGAHPSFRSTFAAECRLLREWVGSPVPVFFDLSGQNLAWLVAGRSNGLVYIAAFPRSQFIGIHHGAGTQGFESFVKDLPELVAKLESPRPAQVFAPYPVRRHRRRL